MPIILTCCLVQDQKADMIIRVDPAEKSIGQSLRGSSQVAPIGPQQATHVENFGIHSGKHAATMISEPWSDDFYSRRQSDLDLEVHGGDAAIEDGNWKMWEAPQLDQIQLPCIKDSPDSLAWMLPLGLSSEVVSPLRMGVSSQVETQLSNSYSSSQPSCPVSLPTMSTSLWSNQPSFFSPTSQQPSGVVGPITQEMMDEPLALADDYFYKHSPTLSELQFCTFPFYLFQLFSSDMFVMFHFSFHLVLSSHFNCFIIIGVQDL